MAAYVRAKRVTDPLDDNVKARLRGDVTGSASSCGSSSGRESKQHEAGLSVLVRAFFEPPASADAGGEPESGGETSDSDNDDAKEEQVEQAAGKVRELLDPKGRADPFRLRLYSDVLQVADALSGLRTSGSGYRWAAMARLRESGYNAGLCRAQWPAAGRITAGSYEYVDVVVAGGAEEEERRYIVDVGFAAEFEVARATAEYEAFRAAALPEVAVARPEDVKRSVREAAKAARRSLRGQGMHVPPWRKKKYMLAKWLGPYLRTTNPLPASARAPVVVASGEVRCRAVGFSAAAAALVAPPAAATT